MASNFLLRRIAVAIFTIAMIVVINFVIDVLYTLIDPRITVK